MSPLLAHSDLGDLIAFIIVILAICYVAKL